ncbi:MAG: hypothetical protein ACP5QU_08685 [Anaerolineae bacterium]
MSFTPTPHLPIPIRGQTWELAEHPAAPGIAYGQEGRAGTVFQLLSRQGEKRALKVFRARFRLPSLVTLAERLQPFASLPGLQACERTVLTPSQDRDLLTQYPDLTYAVLMPWVDGPTWQEVILERKPLSPAQSLALARALAETLTALEERGLAHGDLSGPNVLLPALEKTYQPATHPIALVDVEQMYAPGLDQPRDITSGSAGYAHLQAAGGLWGPEADRFAGAVILAEMLAWCDPQAVDAAWGESYFDPQEMQQQGERYRLLVESLRREWGEAVAALFQRAWRSDSLADCPTFGEWLVALPQVSLAEAFATAPAQPQETVVAAVAPLVAPEPNVLPWPAASAKQDNFERQFQDAVEAYRYREWARARELLLPIVQEAPNYAWGGYVARDLLAEVEKQLRRRPFPAWAWGAIGALAAVVLLGAGVFFFFPRATANPAGSEPMAAAPAASTPQPIVIVQPTQTPYPTYTPYPTNTPFSPTHTPTLSPTPVDINWLIKHSKILVYEDIYGTPLGRWVTQALANLSLSDATIVNTTDALGNFKDEAISKTWDLIIVAAEARDKFSGELFDAMYNHINNGGATIIEIWYLDKVANGKIAPILSQCGVKFQRDWLRPDPTNYDPFKYSIYWLNADHPLLTTPNKVLPPSYPYPSWYGDVGDLIKISGSGDAELVGGLFTKEKSSYGVLTSCLSGRMVIQTFSTHDYKSSIMIPLWQNYIIYTLTNHYKYLYGE